MAGNDGGRDRYEPQFHELYQANYRLVLAYVVNRLGPGEDAHDVVAEVFTTADENGFMETNSPIGLGAYYSVLGGPGALSDLGWSWTVFPSKMPRDGQFVISGISGKVAAADIQAVWKFAKTSAPIACAKFVKPGQPIG